MVSRFYGQIEVTYLTAFKTISMRIRGAKTELEEAGLETDGMAESTATLRKEMQALTGVDIMLDDNTFKSTFQMMDELADKWSGLSDIAQASVIELMAGKRQGNIMSALLSNWDIAESTLQSSLTSDGSAEKELSRYQESMQYALDRLVATAQEFSNVALDDSFLISAIHSATALLELLTAIVDTLGLVPLIGASIGGIAIFKNLD